MGNCEVIPRLSVLYINADKMQFLTLKPKFSVGCRSKKIRSNKKCLRQVLFNPELPRTEFHKV